MSKRARNLIFILTSVLSGAVIYSFTFSSIESNADSETLKVAYVDPGQIISQFKLTQELQREVEFQVNPDLKLIDSLLVEINKIKQQNSKEHPINQEQRSRLKSLIDYYSEVDRRVSLYSENQYIHIEETVTPRINQYIADYASANGFDIIYGANGTGNILYAKDTLNITQDVVKYMNQRYNGE